MGRFETDHSARGVAVSGLALPAVSICQPRPAKRCVSVEGLGEGWETTNQMPKMGEHMADPLLMSGRLVSVHDSVHDLETGCGSCDVLLYLHARPRGRVLMGFAILESDTVNGTRVEDGSTYQQTPARFLAGGGAGVFDGVSWAMSVGSHQVLGPKIAAQGGGGLFYFPALLSAEVAQPVVGQGEREQRRGLRRRCAGKGRRRCGSY